MIHCKWGNCNASFISLTELVGHVNLDHLRLPTEAPAPIVVDSASQVVTPKLSCLWDDCSLYPSPESIPGPSNAETSGDSIMATLVNHLLQDHLGVQSRRNTSPSEQHVRSHPHSQEPPHNHLKGGDREIVKEPVNQQVTPATTTSEKSISTQITQHVCSEGKHECRWRGCGLSFDTCNDLTNHINTAHVGSGKPQYECLWETCNRNGANGFTSKQKICRHIQSHTGHRPFQCSICQQNFSEAATLQQHMRRHTQEKPYVCDYPGCGKAFAITGALTIHKRTHNGHKPFKCSYCDRAFAESSNLSKHLRTHTGARPYSCTEPGCGKAFARPDQLTRHMSVHRKKTNVNAVVC
ncbi:hypothetical protein BDQ17DRAFT_1239677 [Cyathus striatus]|nr:hypothetical protein BDQ17DRAFT_1239677 [Cyathus striatus]